MSSVQGEKRKRVSLDLKIKELEAKNGLMMFELMRIVLGGGGWELEK